MSVIPITTLSLPKLLIHVWSFEYNRSVATLEGQPGVGTNTVPVVGGTYGASPIIDVEDVVVDAEVVSVGFVDGEVVTVGVVDVEIVSVGVVLTGGFSVRVSEVTVTAPLHDARYISGVNVIPAITSKASPRNTLRWMPFWVTSILGIITPISLLTDLAVAIFTRIGSNCSESKPTSDAQTRPRTLVEAHRYHSHIPRQCGLYLHNAGDCPELVWLQEDIIPIGDGDFEIIRVQELNDQIYFQRMISIVLYLERVIKRPPQFPDFLDLIRRRGDSERVAFGSYNYRGGCRRADCNPADCSRGWLDTGRGWLGAGQGGHGNGLGRGSGTS